MKVIPTPVASRGIDCTTVLDSSSAGKLKSAGIDFVVRYLGGVSSEEAQEILAAGLGLQFVSYSRAPGWMPTSAMGSSDGALDLQHLKSVGALPGVTVWIDLEGSAGTAADTAAWIEVRSFILVQAGFLVGLYVGNQCVLNGTQLYALPHVTRYWRAFNEGIPQPQCGWCQFQLNPADQMIAGVEVDYDCTQEDYEGRTPTMMAPTPIA
jgi:hypothetical protein